MTEEEDGWPRLRVLLEELVWDRKRGVFIIAGLDPETTWPADESSPICLKWLPGGLRPEWQGLTVEQIENRAIDVLRIVETRLYGLPSPCSPAQCLCQALGDKRVPRKHVRRQGTAMLDVDYWEPAYIRPGVIPPWLEQARRREELKSLLPRDPHPGRTAANARSHKWDHAKSRVRQLWDAWRFGESSHENERAFIRHVLHVINKPDLQFKIVEQWLKRWRPEVLTAYGDISIVHPGLPGADRSCTVRRGYGHQAIVEPPKAGRPKKV